MKIKLDYQNFFNYLIDTNICKQNELEDIQVQIKDSKTDHWLLNFADGSKLVVKQEPAHRIYNSSNMISHEQHIYQLVTSDPNLINISSLLPEIIHFDRDNWILVYKSPADYITLENYYETLSLESDSKNGQVFPTSVAELVGTSLAKMHLETINFQNAYKNFMKEVQEEEFLYQFPYSEYLLDRVWHESLFKFPAEGFRFFDFYQRDDNLRKTVKHLVDHHQRCCLTHNNPQLNKILIPRQWQKRLSEYSDENLVQLIDWERSNWGDPACDLGTAIAGYLLAWLNSIAVHPAIKLEQSLQLATIPLEVIRPSMVAMIQTYMQTFSKVVEESSDFLKRVIQFAGLALIYQIVENILSHKDFNNQGICMLQVAKNLLCQPEKSWTYIFGVTGL
ncbi:MAG: aminoglycoside phosphotransferase family protein [Nostocaceae cyanobacterium]|nr:aminoglycoside phosphotransferase family protein [Nostocaceae cyanobacterium]